MDLSSKPVVSYYALGQLDPPLLTAGQIMVIGHRQACSFFQILISALHVSLIPVICHS